MRRKNVITIAAVLVLLIAGVVAALPYLIDVNRYRPRLQAALQERLGRAVSLGPMRLRLVPPGLAVQDAVIGEDAAFETGRPFVRIAKLSVGPKLIPLLRGRFELRSVELRDPAIELVRDRSGVWNVSTLRERSAATGSSQAIVLDHLAVTGGMVAVTDHVRADRDTAGGRSEYRDIDIEIDDFARDRPFRLLLAARPSSTGGQRVVLRGTAGPLSPDAAVDTPFEGTLTLENVSLSEGLRYLKVAALDGTDAVVTGQAEVRNQRGVVTSNGSLRLANVRVRGTDLGHPIAADFDVAHDAAAGRLTISRVTLRLSKTPLSIAGTVDLRPVVDARLHASGADLGDLLSIARAWGAADGISGSGRVSVDLRATGPTDALAVSGTGTLSDATLKPDSIAQPLRIRTANVMFDRDAAVLDRLAASLGKTNAEGRLSVRHFTAPQVDFELSADRIDVRELQALLVAGEAPRAGRPPRPADDSIFLRTTGSGRLRVGSIAYDKLLLDNVEAAATLDKGIVRFDPITAGLFGGSHRGVIVADARRSPATFAVEGELQNVDANRLASAATNVRDVIFGGLTARVQMAFGGSSADAMAQSLNGTLSLNLAEGRIANMNVATEIANIVRSIAGREQQQRSTQVAGLRGTFQVTNGVARTDDLTGSIEGGTIGAAGTVSLVDEALDLRLTAVMSSEFAERVAGKLLGGLMTTALANRQGELVVPILVTGSLQRPWFAPDVRRLAEMRAERLKDPRSILGAITGKGRQTTSPAEKPPDAAASPDAPPPPAAPAKPDRAKQVGDALRDLLRGRRQQEKPPSDPQPEPPPAK